MKRIKYEFEIVFSFLFVLSITYVGLIQYMLYKHYVIRGCL